MHYSIGGLQASTVLAPLLLKHRHNKTHCLNPTFPAIHIHTKTEHNAWIHIVYTDSPQWQSFIDAPLQTAPFYSWEQDFYDAPLWRYSLFHKPLSFWKGHVFAVQVGNKIVKCLRGFEWGFQLLLPALRPVSYNSAVTRQSSLEPILFCITKNMPPIPFFTPLKKRSLC